MRKYLFALALSLLTCTSIAALRANAQSCPNTEVFGVRRIRPVDNTLRSQFEVVYFTTNDPNVFISERAGIKRSPSYASFDASQFVARLEGLEREGIARIRKHQSATSYLGEMAELNLERGLVNAGVISTSMTSPDLKYVPGLDRETEISVYKGSRRDGDYYRVTMLSWFVDVTATGGTKTVDYDADVLMKPGQTAVFKLMGDDEVRRSGAARSYVAITLRSVSPVNSAALDSSRADVAIK
jgi:hypothetical protein